MIVVRRLPGGDERQLVELEGVVSAGVGLGDRVGQRLIGPRRLQNLVRVEMDEPVGRQFGGQLLLAAEDLLPAIRAVARDRLDAAEAAFEETLRDLHRMIGRRVVAQIRVDAIGHEVLEAPADETLFVVGGHDGHDARHSPTMIAARLSRCGLARPARVRGARRRAPAQR
jgi:hypothetical protein